MDLNSDPLIPKGLSLLQSPFFPAPSDRDLLGPPGRVSACGAFGPAGGSQPLWETVPGWHHGHASCLLEGGIEFSCGPLSESTLSTWTALGLPHEWHHDYVIILEKSQR